MLLEAQEAQILICDLVSSQSSTGSLLDSIYSEQGYYVERIEHIPESDSFPEVTIIWAGIAEYSHQYELTYGETERIIEGLTSGKYVWGMGAHALFAAELWEWFGFVVLTLDTEPIDSLYGEEFLVGLTWSYNERPRSTIAIMGYPGVSVLDTGPSYPWHMGWRGVAHADSLYHYKALALNVDLSRIVEAETLATVEDLALKVMQDWFELWPVGVEDEEAHLLPSDLHLSNYPNPFNTQTVITYTLLRNSLVTLTIHNILGQKVCTLANARKAAGYYSAMWDGRNDAGELVSSGIYLYRLKAGDQESIKRMSLLR